MRENLLGRLLGFGKTDQNFSAIRNKNTLPGPETYTFENDTEKGWVYVVPDGRVPVGVIQTRTLERLGELTKQVREMTKKTKF